MCVAEGPQRSDVGVRLQPTAPCPRVKHYTTESLRVPQALLNNDSRFMPLTSVKIYHYRGLIW